MAGFAKLLSRVAVDRGRGRGTLPGDVPAPRPSPPKVRPQIAGVEAAGFEVEELARAAGIELSRLRADLPLSFEESRELWRAAVELTGDPAIALHAAQNVPYGAFDLLDYLPGNSPTVGAGFEDLVAVFNATRVGVRLELVREAATSELRIDYEPRPELLAVRRYAIEFTLGTTLLRFHSHGEAAWRPRRLRLRYADPGYREVYTQVFGCPVEFAAEVDALVVDSAVLELRLPRADERLRALLHRHAEHLERWAPQREQVRDRLRRALAEELPGEGPRLERVARRLAMSSRTLHRRLAEEGTSFRAELDQLRADAAVDLLRDDALALTEIAYLLGFAEPSGFSRAFRRWWGVPPAVYRRRARNA